MSIVIKTDQTHRRGLDVVLPLFGKVDISHEGTFETEDEALAKQFVEAVSDYYIVDNIGSTTVTPESINLKSQQNELGSNKDGEAIVTNEGSSGAAPVEFTEEEKAQLLPLIETMTKAELLNLCNPFPSPEWKGLNKGDLIAYLKTKLA